MGYLVIVLTGAYEEDLMLSKNTKDCDNPLHAPKSKLGCESTHYRITILEVL
jgi:hypothetical protein